MRMIIIEIYWNVLVSLEKYKTSSLEGGMQPGVEPGVKPNASSLLISKIVNTVLITPNSMASSLSQSDESIHVSFIHFNK